MLRLARWSAVPLGVAALVACSDHTEVGAAHAAHARKLAGIWNARWRLDEPAILTANTGVVASEVTGRLALLENLSLDRSYPEFGPPTDYGTYDADFTPFGFDSRDAGHAPTAIAGWTAGDSVVILLDPGGPGTPVTMRGVLAGDSLTGEWDVTVSRATGGGGRFRMWRHRER